MEFYHLLVKYKRTNSFSRSKWVVWRANIDLLVDLEFRLKSLSKEKALVEQTFTCPAAFKVSQTLVVTRVRSN
mgnify:CR=1 FL=1|jgi:hypothetical protein